MGNSLRCCLACVLPCGALDLIRIVHLNGTVEEFAGPVTAGEVIKNNPNHLLSKPSSQGVVRRILILSPETELKRGTFYFLIPESSLPENKKRRLKRKSSNHNKDDAKKQPEGDPFMTQITSSEKKKSSHRDRRSGRVGVWRPHLESILED